jgi:hypothetical protein
MNPLDQNVNCSPPLLCDIQECMQPNVSNFASILELLLFISHMKIIMGYVVKKFSIGPVWVPELRGIEK